MIKNLIFDFGNVICRYRPKELVSCYTNDLGDRALLLSAIFQRWSELDSGRMSYREYTEEACRTLPEHLHKTVEAFFADWHTRMPYVAGMERLIFDLKAAGYRLYLLSNAPAPLEGQLSEFSVYPCFSGALISGSVELTKPSKEIYDLALERFGIRAEETLFIDDREENIEGATSAGLRGIVFNGDAADLRERELPRYGVRAE